MVDQEAVPINDAVIDGVVIEVPTLNTPFDGFTEIILVEPPAIDGVIGEVALEFLDNTMLYSVLSVADTTDTFDAVAVLVAYEVLIEALAHEPDT